MKSFPSRRGFTLIELLTVIAIIVVLMGLLFPAIGSVKETMRKTQAKNDVTQIVTAVKAYYTEYGKYPVESASSDTEYSSSNYTLFDILRGVTSSGGTDLNPRKIVFLEVNDAKDQNNPKSGIDQQRNWRDPWGNAYRVKLDTDYDNTISGPNVGGTTDVRTGVIAWSQGKSNSSTYKDTEWVLSWK